MQTRTNYGRHNAPPVLVQELNLEQLQRLARKEKRQRISHKLGGFYVGFVLTVVVYLLSLYGYAVLWYWPNELAKEQAARVPTIQPLPVVTSDIRSQWAVDFARLLGNDQPSQDIVDAIVAWTLAEDACIDNCGYASAFARHNPLNTTQAGYNETGVHNSVGVRAYATREDGLAATVQTLTYDYQGYAEIKAGIQTNDVERLINGIQASPWCPCGQQYPDAIRRLYYQVKGK